jgi:hypothetical protein
MNSTIRFKKKEILILVYLKMILDLMQEEIMELKLKI